MKRLTVFVASAALALLPLSSARAGPTGQPLGCGPAADVAEPTGLALVDDGSPAEEAAPVLTGDPLKQGSDTHTISDHDIYVALIAACVVLLLVILF
ncbi:MAG TPA: hypothetical protein VFY71_05855 [Planctomycetota bacterium]|nr:hypothetical protein [Planctomycetota bacterium]